VVRLVKQLAEGYGSWLLDPGFPIGILDVQKRRAVPARAEVSLETFPVPTPRERGPVPDRARGPAGLTGDTGPRRAGPVGLRADLLLAECSLPKEMAMDIHLTPEQAGELAPGCQGRQLVLTPLSRRLKTSDPARAAGTRFTGRVTAARDGDRSPSEGSSGAES